MRLGINHTPEHRTPEEWGDILIKEGFRATAFPVDYHAKQKVIDGYAEAARCRDIRIAEVGVWCSPWTPDLTEAEIAKERCVEQLRLAEYVKADCCVNVSGAAGENWSGCYPENFSPEMYRRNVEFIRELCDTVKPAHTCYTLEPMQWMAPDSPEQYQQLLRDVNRDSFAVHMDIVNFIKDPYTYTHQEELIQKTFAMLGKQVKSCHLKDCRMEPGLTVAIHEVLLGRGEVRLPVYLAEIDRLGGDLPVLLEHLPDMDSYRKAAEYARGIWVW